MLLELLAQQSSSPAPFLFGGGLLFIIALILIFGTSIFWIWMLIDCLASSKPGIEKLVWLLVIFFGHFLGALIYFIVGRSRSTLA